MLSSMPTSPNLVLDDGELLSVRLSEDVVEERRLAGTEEAREHRDRALQIVRGIRHCGSSEALSHRSATVRRWCSECTEAGRSDCVQHNARGFSGMLS